VFKDFFREALESRGAFAVIDRESGRMIGSSRYYGYDAARREIEIGWTFLARAFWGGIYNREMKTLMLRHAFRFVDRVIFLVGPQNFRSQRAMKKIGGVRVGTTRREPGGPRECRLRDYPCDFFRLMRSPTRRSAATLQPSASSTARRWTTRGCSMSRQR
jgi:RimJ/RimL family protein N-acetyltransferase